jgi:hypothetical protein
VYAAHFAAGLAIKSCVPEAPAWALLTGAFLPDFVWIALANRGIEPTNPQIFFDDWSHSLVMVIFWASLFAIPFWRYGRKTLAAVWLAVFSHFLLDLPIHPKFLALYPHSVAHMGIVVSATLGAMNYWWVQLAVLLPLTGMYAWGASRSRHSNNLIAASAIFLIGLHLLMFPG